MAFVSKFVDLDGSSYDLKAVRTAAIPFGRVDGTSTSTKFTASVEGITELYDGVCCYLMNGAVTSAANWTLNVNGLGAKPVYSTLAAETRTTTIFNVAYTMLFVYNSTRIEGGCWDIYYGYDSNTNTIGYQVRTNSSTRPVSDQCGRYRLLFSSADDTKWVPANTSSSTNATSSRAVNQRPIDPFGEICYYSYTTVYAAGTNVGTSYQWSQNVLTFGYSFNRTGAALTLTYPAPVYIKCAPQTDGSAIIDADTPYVQALPSTADGKIYIYLGKAYSATNVELVGHHPVYEYKDGQIRLYTNAANSAVSVTANRSVGASIATVANVDILAYDKVEVDLGTIDATASVATDDGQYIRVNLGSRDAYDQIKAGLAANQDVWVKFILPTIVQLNVAAANLICRIPYIGSSSDDDVTFEKFGGITSVDNAYGARTYNVGIAFVNEVPGMIFICVKQIGLWYDSAPTQDSRNLVRSGGIYTWLSNQIIKVTATAIESNPSYYTIDSNFDSIKSALLDGKTVLVKTSDALYPYLTSVTVFGLEFLIFGGFLVYDGFFNNYLVISKDANTGNTICMRNTGSTAYVSSINGLSGSVSLSYSDIGAQEQLTFDTVPTSGSSNPVTSDGIYQVIGDVETLLAAI